MPFGYIQGGKPRSFIINSTAAIAKGAVVKYSASGKCVVATSDATGILGLARDAGSGVVGDAIAVVQDGKFDGNAAASITAGQALMPTTAGAVTPVTGTGTHYIVGYAEEDASSGDKVSIRVQPGQLYLP